MVRYSDEEKRSILQAKLNETISDVRDHTGMDVASTDPFHSTPDAYETKSAIRETYEAMWSSDKKDAEFLCTFLKATKVPKYVELARILSMVQKNNSYMKEELRIEQAEFLVANASHIRSNYGSRKSTYKEFEQIAKRRERSSAKTRRKLKKYADVERFYRIHMTSLCLAIQERFYWANANFMLTEHVYENQEDVIDFLSNCKELEFLAKNKEFRKL